MINRIFFVFALSGTLALTGCDAINSFNLSVAQQELRQECFGRFTNSCISKTIDFNIKAIELVTLPQHERNKLANVFGNKGLAIYEEVEAEIKDKKIKSLESKRPGFFARWLLGDSQPLDEKDVTEFSTIEAKSIRDEVLQLFTSKLRDAGIQPNKEDAAKYNNTAR